jgi:multiple sugar transport system permease protein
MTRAQLIDEPPHPSCPDSASRQRLVCCPSSAARLEPGLELGEEAAIVDGCSLFGAFIKMALPLSLPGILTVVIFTFTLTLQEFVYALTFISSSAEKPITLGVATDLIRGDIYYWGEIMAGALIASIPVAIAYNFFLDRFIAGITGGAVK